MANVNALRLRVGRIADVAARIRIFELVDPGQPLPAFSAGAHVHLPSDLERHYSLCNDPVETHR